MTVDDQDGQLEAPLPQDFRVVFAPTVAVREAPDLKSHKIGQFRCGEVIQTLRWDTSKRWRQVRIKNEWWQLVEGWVQVVSEHLGVMLEPVAPQPLREQNGNSRYEAFAADASAESGAGAAKAAAAAAAASKQSRFAAYAQKKGVDLPPEMPELRLAEAARAPEAFGPFAEKPPRSSVGQWYEVVHRPHVAVRLFPSVDAPAIRCAKFGTRVELFEWDHSREWRRITTAKAVDKDEYAEFDEEEARSRGVEVVDGWMMVEHPSYGPLLQACAREEPPWSQWAPLETAVPRPRPEPEDTPARPVSIFAEGPRGPPPSAADLDAKRWLEQKVLASVEERPGLEEPRLMRAARAGSYEVVRNMLSDMEDPNKTDAMGESALFEAASAGRTDIVGLLLLCMADPFLRARDGTSVTAITSDPVTLALLQKWRGEEVDDKLLRAAILRLNPKDGRRVAARFQIDYEEGELEVARPWEAPAPSPAKPPAPVQPVQEPAPSAPSGTAAVSSQAPAPPPVVSPTADVSTLEDIELDENGVPKRIEVPTMYRVVYKMVAVRRSPASDAPMIRAKKLGEVVEMFEWDATRTWRRVRTTAPQEEGAGSAELEEVDGWMLIRSDKVGVLLQEIPPEEAEGEEEEEEFAG